MTVLGTIRDGNIFLTAMRDIKNGEVLTYSPTLCWVPHSAHPAFTVIALMDVKDGENAFFKLTREV